MNKIIKTIGEILVFLVLIMAIDTVTFSSIMFILEYFGDDIGIAVSLNVLSFAIVSCLTQVWLFFYFILDVNIFAKGRKHDG